MATIEPPMPIRDGYRAALDRVSEDGLFDGEPDADAQGMAQQTLDEALDVLNGDEPSRYILMYAEVTAVGAFARARYGEAPLDRAELESFDHHLRGFLNSWVHRHG